MASSKKLPEGVAKQVVQATKDEVAWHRFAGQFDPSLVAMRGDALADVAAIARHPATKPLETQQLLINFQAKRKRLEDITGEDTNGASIMSVRQSMIDDTTKQHTVDVMPKVMTREMVDRYFSEIVSIINTVTGGSGAADRGPAPMQVGALQGPVDPSWHSGARGGGFNPGA